MLTDRDVAGMRSALGNLLPDTGTIWRKATTIDGGEQVETWTELATVACRVRTLGGGEGEDEGGRLSQETTHLITVAAGTDVEEVDVVVIGEQAYEATAIQKRGNWELTRRVEAKESTDFEAGS